VPSSLLSTAVSYAALELRRTLRDPQVLVFLGFPVVLYPSLIWGVTELGQLEQGRYDQETYVVAAPADLRALLDDEERLEVVSEGDTDALQQGTVDAWLSYEAPADVEVHHLEARPRSVRAATEVKRAIRRGRTEVLTEEVSQRGGPSDALDAYTIDDDFLEDRTQLTSWIIGLLMGAIGPLAMLLSGVYPAIDLFVVERERDTLETLLVSAVPRSAVVIGKLAACTLLMLTASLANMGALAVSALHVTTLLLEQEALASWPPLVTWPMLGATLVSAALLCASVLMASLVPARTYKEGEWITTTVLFGSFPLLGVALLGVMSGDTNPWLWAVPFAHTILAIAQAPTGELLPWQAAVTVVTDLGLTAVLLAVLWRTPGPQGLVAGAWRPPWLDRLMGSS